jgi:hypothetical protein
MWQDEFLPQFRSSPFTFVHNYDDHQLRRSAALSGRFFPLCPFTLFDVTRVVCHDGGACLAVNFVIE